MARALTPAEATVPTVEPSPELVAAVRAYVLACDAVASATGAGYEEARSARAEALWNLEKTLPPGRAWYVIDGRRWGKKKISKRGFEVVDEAI